MKDLWYCLEACGEGGSVIDWVMESEGGAASVTAVEILREGASEALDSLDARSLRDDGVISRFRLGFAHRTLDL